MTAQPDLAQDALWLWQQCGCNRLHRVRGSFVMGENACRRKLAAGLACRWSSCVLTHLMLIDQSGWTRRLYHATTAISYRRHCIVSINSDLPQPSPSTPV